MSATIVSPRKRTMDANNADLQHWSTCTVRNTIQRSAANDFIPKGTVLFYNVSYTVVSHHENWYLPLMRSRSKRQIMSDVSGIFTPGMNAIMGKTYHLT